MKHSYQPTCDCPRCQRERTRRTAQAFQAVARIPMGTNPRRRRIARPTATRRPVWGSQEWAETRGDDIEGGGDR